MNADKIQVQLRKVRALCPQCGGNVADKTQISFLSDNPKPYIATVCRNCTHEWNAREVRPKAKKLSHGELLRLEYWGASGEAA